MKRKSTRASLPRSTVSESVCGQSEELAFSTVRTAEQFYRALALTYQLYLKAGYCDQHHSQLRYSIQMLLPVVRTFVALAEERVIATGSIVFDSLAKVPADAFFATQLDLLRDNNRTFCEGTQLACTNYQGYRANKISETIIRKSLCYAAVHDMDDYIVVVNPKHLRFWCDTLGFSILSEPRSCAYVKGHPGVLLHLDLRDFFTGDASEHLEPPCYYWPTEEELLTPFYLSRIEVVSLLQKRPELIGNCTLGQLQALTYHYPGIIDEATYGTLNIGIPNRELRA